MSSIATIHRIPPFTLFARLRTWWIILRISIEERLVYRGEFMLGTLMRFLPVITQIFFWAAVFSAASADNSATTSAAPVTAASTIAGYTYSRLHRLLFADDGDPRVFQHADACLGHRQEHPRRHDQEISRCSRSI